MKKSYFLTAIAALWGICVCVLFQNRKTGVRAEYPIIVNKIKPIDSVIQQYDEFGIPIKEEAWKGHIDSTVRR